ncbi:MAG TPA: signal peptidase I [bacterium]|nr:signal peptidase I [bacterium]
MSRLRAWYDGLWGRYRTSLWREGIETIVVALGLALLIRAFIVQAFYIPSSSMEDTLLIDDHILVNKFVYRFSDPQRHDIVVFIFPGSLAADEPKDYIKRVIGRPGETVLVRGGLVYLNGDSTPLREPFAIQRGDFDLRGDYGPVRVPRVGEAVRLGELNDWERELYHELQRRRGRDLRWIGNRAFIDGVETPTLTIDQEYYFVMGDNRKNSQDSRFWGFLSRDRIHGRAFCIYWPLNRIGLVE